MRCEQLPKDLPGLRINTDKGFTQFHSTSSRDLADLWRWGQPEAPDTVEKVGSRGSFSSSSVGLRSWHILLRNLSLGNHITSHLRSSMYLHFSCFNLCHLSSSKRTPIKKINYSRKLRTRIVGKLMCTLPILRSLSVNVKELQISTSELRLLVTKCLSIWPAVSLARRSTRSKPLHFYLVCSPNAIQGFPLVSRFSPVRRKDHAGNISETAVWHHCCIWRAMNWQLNFALISCVWKYFTFGWQWLLVSGTNCDKAYRPLMDFGALYIGNYTSGPWLNIYWN